MPHGWSTSLWLKLERCRTCATHQLRRGLWALALLLTITLILARARQRRQDAVLSFASPEGRQTEPMFPPLPNGCNPTSESSSLDRTMVCDNFPTALLSSIQIVIKTGAAEKEKTKSLLNTMASCISNALIVSDVQEVLAGHQVHDILSELPASYAVENPDWEIYSQQQKKSVAGEPITKSHDGWKLDRFKFLPMVEKAYKLAPKAKWYVFIEADVYIFWDTLFRLLSTMNPDQYHYVGSPAPGSHGVWFAYGGGGIIMSGKLVRAVLRGGQQRVSVKYEQMVKDDCCGDAVLAYVIYRELRHRLRASYTTFSGEDAIWLRVGKQNWHTPLMGLHHVSIEQMEALWKWERCRPSTSEPITHASFLDYALSPLAGRDSISNWGNRPDYRLPDADAAHESIQTCKSACERNSTCLQYQHSREAGCRISDWVCTGEAIQNESEGYISGWSLPRLEEMGFVPGRTAGI